MRQVIQSYRTGTTRVVEVPAPLDRPGHVLVRTHCSVISAGTERAVVQSGGARGLVAKARARPDLVNKVLDKARAEGIDAAVRAVTSTLDRPVPLGYSAAGVVLSVGDAVEGVEPGDAVACAGAGYASHAEVLSVPRNLCARVPDGVSFADAAFATIGAIALQGVRTAAPQIGEAVAVVGLGLVGQLTVQLLRVAGCKVLALDLDPARAELARTFGAHGTATDEAALKSLAGSLTAGRGLDAVLLTAATPSSGPVELAGELAREKGRVVVVGDVGLRVPRAAYYQKELELRLSRSYGPGRYDPKYEELGIDYPYGYVRWTEQRNLEAFLGLVADGSVRTEPLVTHTFPIERAPDAYRALVGRTDTPSSAAPAKPLAILLTYPSNSALERTVAVTASSPGLAYPAVSDAYASGAGETTPLPSAGPRMLAGPRRANGAVRVGVIGAGAFARSVLLPAMRNMPGVTLTAVATQSGVSARHAAESFGFARATTDPRAVLADSAIDAVIIATRHDSHAKLAIQALEAGKAVMVEKPLGLTMGELRAVLATQRRTGRQLLVGLNRRFSPLVSRLKMSLSARRAPLLVTYRVNAGSLPRDSWIHDPAQGGGRLVAEGCHFVDVLQYLIGATPVSVRAHGFRSTTVRSDAPADNVTLAVSFEDGSIGTLVYASAGTSVAGKELIEGFGEDVSFTVDDFRGGRFASRRATWREPAGWSESARALVSGRLQNKGHAAELEAFVACVRAGSDSPLSPFEAARATQVTLKAQESMASGSDVSVDDSELFDPEGGSR